MAMSGIPYPEHIISRDEWRERIDTDSLLLSCADVYTGRRIELEAGVSEGRYIDDRLGEGMERLTEEALPDKRVPDLSMSLLGALFGIGDFSFIQKGRGEELWNRGRSISLPEIGPGDFERVRNEYFVAAWMVRELHNIKFPYTRCFDSKKSYDKVRDQIADVLMEEWDRLSTLPDNKSLHKADMEGTAKIEHSPVILNYWHFIITLYPQEASDSPIHNNNGAWRKCMAHNVGEMLRGTFIKVPEGSDVPCILDTSLWEDR